MTRTCIFVLLVIGCCQASAWEDKVLSGSYRIAGRTVIDPPANEANDSHVHFYLTGFAAQDLYRAMKVKAKPDECVGKGALIETIGEMACMQYADRKEFKCWFAVDVAKQRITGAYAC